MIARYWYTVELWCELSGVGENVLYDPHGFERGVDVRVTYHVLLQYIVLNRSCVLAVWKGEDGGTEYVSSCLWMNVFVKERESEWEI